MPNWCANTLIIKGTKTQTNKILKKIQGKEDAIDFNKIKPMPKSLYKPSSPWYEWTVTNWGTKWNACSSSLDLFGENEARISFNTAWSPPTPIIVALGEKFPNVTFELRYYEPAMGFAGVFTVKGQKIKDEFYECSKNRKQYKALANEFE